MKHSRIWPCSTALLIAMLTVMTSSFAEDANQRQLREDRARFQREVDRQASDAKIRDDQARMAAEQQRTAAELERLRSQQARQSSELRTLTTTTRAVTDAPAVVPSPRIAASSPLLPETSDVGFTAVATITPDFSVTLLADGRCVVYVKGRPPEVKSPAEAQSSLHEFLAAPKPTAPKP